MKRMLLTLFAVTLLAGSTGCCCVDRLFCGGCRGGCSYGNEGPSYGGCGSGGCSTGGCSDCGMAGARQVTGPGMARNGAPRRPNAMPPEYAGGPAHPAQGHPFVKQRRNSGDEYEFAAGPPSAGVTYPYYTNRGPRDFLARNPRDIGP